MTATEERTERAAGFTSLCLGFPALAPWRFASGRLSALKYATAFFSFESSELQKNQIPRLTVPRSQERLVTYGSEALHSISGDVSNHAADIPFGSEPTRTLWKANTYEDGRSSKDLQAATLLRRKTGAAWHRGSNGPKNRSR